MANVHKLKSHAKSGKKRSTNQPSRAVASSKPFGAGTGAHYAAGPAPGIAVPIQGKALQFQTGAEDRDEERVNLPGEVQMMCAECEAEQRGQPGDNVRSRSGPDQPDGNAPEDREADTGSIQMAVQFWDCGDYPEPTCSIQSKAASAGQREDEPEEPVQAMCAECEAEGAGEVSSEQNNGAPDNGEQPAVQMWDCGDYPEPTCSIQSKEADSREEQPEPEEGTIVQGKCSACEEEADTGGDAESGSTATVQNKVTRGGLRRGGGPAGNRKSAILKQASAGLKNAHSPLPYGDRIQKAFGHHDISGVRTETGGPAGLASKNMRALAYASGNRIGFLRTPSLHLAAHEAAHTVQQRSGLKLPGNVGKPGDPWERHADRVADAVVAGESAEPLLDSVAPASRPKADSPGTHSAPSNGSGIAPQVQGNITAGASHQVEPEQAEEEQEGAGGGAAATAESEGGGASGESAEAEQSEAAEETAEAAQENEPDPAEDCERAQGEGDEGEQQQAPQQEGGGQGGDGQQAPSGPPEKGRCYNARAPDPPEGAQEPAQDSPPNESESEADVSYGEWEEPNDACECAAADAMAQQSGGAAEQGQSLLSAQVSEPSPQQARLSGQGGAASGSGGGEASGGGGEVASGADVASSAGAQTGSGGGGGGGGAGPEAGAEANFSEGEASRDTAVADYMAATDEVAQVPNRALRLSKGLSFEGASGGGAAREAARAMALSRIRSFMLNASAQIGDAVAFVRDEVPSRLGAMAESVKAGIDASMLEQKAAISARIASARAAATGEAAGAREAILSTYGNNVDLVNAETDSALQMLAAAYESSQTAVDVREDEALTEVSQRFAEGRADHETKGEDYAARAIATGQDWVSSYNDCRAGPGNDYERNGDDGFWDGCLTVRRAHAQQKAACSTASGFAKNMIDMGKKKGFELREQRTQYRCAVISGAGQAQSTLDTAIERLTSGLESGREGTLSGLAQVRDMNISAVDAALTATLHSLDRQERQQRQAVNDSGYVQQVAVEQMAHQVAAGLARSVSSAMESLEQTLQQVREQLLQGDAPPPDVLTQVLTAAEVGLGGGVGTLLDKMDEGAAGAETQLLQAGSNAAGALAEISSGNDSMTAESESGFQSQMATLVGAASDSMAQLSERQVTRAQESAAQGSESMEQIAIGFEDATGEIYTRVDTAISTSLSELDTELKNMEDGLEAKIAAEAWRAASKEQPAWKGVVAIVLIVLVIIVSVVVTVLTAGAFGPVGLVIIGAIVGGITAGLMQIINNWAAGEEWDKGLVQAVVIGAVGGALGGAIGAGANSLAQAAVQGAVRAGASTLTRAAINVGINLAGDLVAEGATQTFSYFAYGQQFNWQGFVMAGGMSMLSTARGGITGGPHAGPHADVNVPAPSAGSRAISYATDAAIGMGFAAGIEGVNVLAGGEFDLNRFASTAAGAGSASRAAALSHAAGSRSQGGAETGASTPRPAAETSAPRSHAEPPTTPTPHAETPATTTPRPQAETPSAPTPRGHADTPEATTPRPSAEPGAETTTPRAPGEALETTTARPGDAEQPAPTRRPAAEDTETPATRGSAEGDGEVGRPRSEIDIEQTPRRPSDAEANEPINQKSSAEIEEMSRTPSKVGDAEHENYVRKTSETEIECDICSRACGPIKEKINEIENEIAQKSNRTADDADIIEGLQEIKGNIKAAEDSIEGRLVDGEFMAGRSVIELAGKIADGFRSLGQRHKVLGDAINDPTAVRGDREPFALSGRGPGDVDVSALHLSDKLELGQSNRFGMDEFENISRTLGDEQQCVYVLRGPEPDRIILKVGKSQQSNVGSRFGKYRRAGEALGMDLTLEVTPLKPGMTETDASGVESAMRSGLEHEGHIMPWDNTPGGFGGGHQHPGRLNRPGTGVPFEPIRGPSYKSPETGKRLRGPAEHEWTPDASVVPREGAGQTANTGSVRPSPEALGRLFQESGNNVSALRDTLAQGHGLDRSMSTIYRWLREAGISTQGG